MRHVSLTGRVLIQSLQFQPQSSRELGHRVELGHPGVEGEEFNQKPEQLNSAFAARVVVEVEGGGPFRKRK
jgi:hypothetical protein